MDLKVEGELKIQLPTDLRALYQVPFSAEKAAQDPEAVRILNDCCYQWIQSVEKVINQLQNVHSDEKDKKGAKKKKEDLAPKAEAETAAVSQQEEKGEGGKEEEEKQDEVENKVLEEIVAWETKLARCERLEEQLKMGAVNRAMAILNSTGNVHAKTMTTVSVSDS